MAKSILSAIKNDFEIRQYIFHNSTEQLQTTVEELRAQNELMNAIFNAISDGIIVADKEGRYTLFNERAGRVVGQEVGDIYTTAEKSIAAISTDALHVLMRYDFPGNVRELENAIESAVLLETTDLLQQRSLPLQILESIPQTHPTGNLTDASVIYSLDEVERKAIRHALNVTGNNISAAALALGIDRTTLHRKLKEYRIRQ